MKNFNNLLNNVVDAMPEYIFWKDKDSIFMGCNNKFAQLIGLDSPQDIVGKTDFDISPLEEAKRFVKTDKEIIAKDKPIINVIEKHKDKILKSIKKPLKNENGEIIGTICIMEALSEDESKIKKYFKEQDAKYKLLVENLIEGIWVLDKDFKTAFANKVMTNLLKYDPQEIIGKPMKDIVCQNKIKALQKQCSLKEPKRQHCKTTLIDKSGNKIYVSLNCSSFFDKKGEFKGIIASILDLTEEKAQQEQIRKKEETYKSLIELTNTAFFILNSDFNIVQTNQSFSEMIQVDIDSLIGRNPRAWVHSEDIKTFDEAFNKLEMGIPIKELEIRLINKNNPLYVNINANIIINGSKKIICLLRDISLKKEYEAKKYINEQKTKDRIKQKIFELRGKLKEV
jgi:PAS domain S-box-containing protein